MGGAGPAPAEIRTARLRLIPVDAESLAALINGEPEPTELRHTVRFPRPFAPPPLTDDAFPFILERLNAEPDGGWWSVWMFSRTDTRDVVGAGGFAGPPDEQGALQIGYSVYESQQGQGFATEAVQALLNWALARDQVRAVRATIPPWNGPSVRVAAKVGMRQVGVGRNDEVGEIHVFEIVTPRSR